MHRELAAEFLRIVDSPDVERFAFAAPRGNAKTTFLLAFLLWCIVYGRKRFIIFITSTAELADIFLGDIKAEMEDNERLLEDFPEATGRGRLWRENAIVTRNEVRVQALGAGKKIRGRKHRQYRPQLIVVDDFESDEHVRNIEQRDKHYAWLTKAVLKARGVAQKCDFLLSGTLLHFDSVLARMLDVRKNPGWRRKVYRAVISWAHRKDLWDEWERIYTDWHLGDEERHAAAHAFYDANRAAMLTGTAVLWPEGEDYYDLMRQRIDDGPTAFQTEKQNEPLDPSQCEFPEEWFEFFDEVERSGETWLVPDRSDAIRLADCDVYGALDPSKGRHDRHGDPSALISIAAYPGQHLPAYNGRYQTFWAIDGDIAWKHPHVLEDRIFELHQLRRYQRFGVESVQFQELFAEGVAARALADPSVLSLHVVKLTPISDKKLRIQKLGPYIYAGRLKFGRRHAALFDQLRYFPQHAHDDGPDGVELCLETIGEIGWVMLDMDEPERKTIERRQRMGELDRQIEQMLPEAYADPGGGPTCGQCLHREAQGDLVRCGLRDFRIKDKDPACDSFDAPAG